MRETTVFQLSLPMLIYYFSCRFLWVTLSLFLYLDEEVAQGTISILGLQWSKFSEDLAHWVTTEWHYVMSSAEISQEEKDSMSLIAGKLGDLLLFHFADVLGEIAADSHARKPILSEAEWLYYYYCSFLSQVLDAFDLLIRELNDSYYRRYQESITLFQDMAVIKKERPSLQQLSEVNVAIVKSVWVEIDAVALELATKWHQAVLEVARNQKLPNFVENDL